MSQPHRLCNRGFEARTAATCLGSTDERGREPKAPCPNEHSRTSHKLWTSYPSPGPDATSSGR